MSDEHNVREYPMFLCGQIFAWYSERARVIPTLETNPKECQASSKPTAADDGIASPGTCIAS